ncbi:MAG: ribosome small subunit-dependent GTPase A [Muribaculaceae bacterium]|nr:ribosome small subunit-dependent GTPase A [Muribaculaceae bacterium]
MKQRGTVIRSTGSWQEVRLDDGRVVQCKVKGTMRLMGLRCTNPVAVGDVVDVTLRPDDGTALIAAVEPRRNYVIRRASNLSREFQIIGANLDLALLVVSLSQPLTSTTFIDRFLATCEAYRVPAAIAINKADLLHDEPDGDALLEAVATLYRTIGYRVTPTSTVTGEGIDELRALLSGKTTLLSGNSGVGKSSIINALVPGVELRVGRVSDAHNKGTHTTTFSEMIDLPGSGRVIDTPGVKGFGTIDFERAQVAHYFPEIFAASRGCRYGDCTHTHEPGCAVLDAVQHSLISQSRYASYLSILEDTDGTGDKYRKPY